MYFSLFRGLKRYKKTHNRVKGIYRDYGFSNWQAINQSIRNRPLFHCIGTLSHSGWHISRCRFLRKTPMRLFSSTCRCFRNWGKHSPAYFAFSLSTKNLVSLPCLFSFGFNIRGFPVNFEIVGALLQRCRQGGPGFLQ